MIVEYLQRELKSCPDGTFRIDSEFETFTKAIGTV